MKRNIQYLLTVLCPLLLLAGCTLMMDEAGQAAPPADESGDGFSAPRTEVSDMGRVTYQFAEGTMLLDERYRPYILRFSADSTYHNVEVYLARSIPADLLPRRGNCLATTLHDIFDMGLYHRVDQVEDAGVGYRLTAHAVHTSEVYKCLRLETDFYVERTDSDSTVTRSVATDTPGYRLVGAYGRTRSEESDILDYRLLDTGLELQNVKQDEVWKKVLKTDKWIDPKTVAGKIKGGISGDCNAYATYQLGFKVTLMYDELAQSTDFRCLLYHKLAAGVYGQEMTATVSFPVAGCSYYLKPGTKKRPLIFQERVYNGDDYFVELRELTKPFAVGPIVGRFFLAGNFVIDLYAGVRSSVPFQWEYSYGGKLAEFGFHKDEQGEYAYPTKKDKAATSDIYETLDNVAFTAGLRFNLNFQAGVRLAEVAKANINVDPSLEIRYTGGSAGDGMYKDLSGQELAYAENGHLDLDLTLDLSMAGELDFKFMTVPLGRITLGDLTPFVLVSHTTPLHPQLQASITPDDSASTSNDAYYHATVTTVPGTGYLLPVLTSTPPMLYIYTSYGKLLKCIYPDDAKGGYDPRHEYTYSFWLPNDVTIYDYLVALPVLEQRYSKPLKFRRGGLWMRISNLEQMRVAHGSMADGQIYAFKFNLKGHQIQKTKALNAEITIEDGMGNLVGYQNFELERLGTTFDRDYLFLFSGKPDGQYLVKLYLNADVGYRTGLYMDSGKVLLMPGGGTETFDYREATQSGAYTQGYEILE